MLKKQTRKWFYLSLWLKSSLSVICETDTLSVPFACREGVGCTNAQFFGYNTPMSDIQPLNPEQLKKKPPSLFKVGTLAILMAGIFVFGILAQQESHISSQSSLSVLGEDTQTLESYLPDTIKQPLTLIATKEAQVETATLFDAGKEMLSSEAAKLASHAGAQVEKVASDAAQNVTDFVYKNTIERIINTLIQSLPVERQQQYK